MGGESPARGGFMFSPQNFNPIFDAGSLQVLAPGSLFENRGVRRASK